MKNSSFDPSCEFLLDWQFQNLFFQKSSRIQEFAFICKGCGKEVMQWNRKEHFDSHKKTRAMFREAARLTSDLNRESGTSSGFTRTDICTQCGSSFEQERKRGRPRKKCFECLPPTGESNG